MKRTITYECERGDVTWEKHFTNRLLPHRDGTGWIPMDVGGVSIDTISVDALDANI